MGMFVKKERIPISDDQGNTIYIRSKMDYGTVNKVNGAALRLTVGQAQREEEIELDVGAYQVALLQYNIIAWSGPDFTGEDGKLFPCNPMKIAELDPEQPILAVVLEEIAARNKPKKAPSPNGVATSGSMSAGASDTPED